MATTRVRRWSETRRAPRTSRRSAPTGAGARRGALAGCRGWRPPGAGRANNPLPVCPARKGRPCRPPPARRARSDPAGVAAPAPIRAPGRFAEGQSTTKTAGRVLGAMEHGGELVLLNTGLTPGGRAVQRNPIAAIPPAGEPAAVLFTSGTTGTPKAARLARDNLEANARAANEVLEVEGRSRFLCVLPLFHVGGLGILFRCQLAGATVLLHERFDPQAVARDLRERATHASLVTSTLARVLEQGAAFPPAIVAVGGGPVPGPLLEHPAVREAAVLRASDERWGQVGLAYVVTTASDEELRDFLRTRLAVYKVPARFVRLRELPRNAAGKVDRAGLLAGNPAP